MGNGLLVTGYSKSVSTGYMANLLGGSVQQYNNYSLYFGYPVDLKDYEWKPKLRSVRIYFDTPTFDKITKDRAAKFVDILSAIGGTMGLLTGFSIISGVEIVYFAAKIT